MVITNLGLDKGGSRAAREGQEREAGGVDVVFLDEHGGLAKSMVGCPGGLAGRRAPWAADEGWSRPVGAGRWSLAGDDSGRCA